MTDDRHETTEIHGSTGAGSAASGGRVDAGSVSGRDHVRSGDVHVRVSDRHETKPLRDTPTGVAVRLDGLETQISRFAELQAEQWDRFGGRLDKLEALFHSKDVSDAISNRDTIEMQQSIAILKKTLLGNGALGTARWERITRAMVALALLGLFAMTIMLIMLAIQVGQNSQQIAIIIDGALR